VKHGLKLIAYFASITLLAACASQRVAQPLAPDSEKQAAVAAYSNCLIPYAKRLDDGRSDAKTIAQAMRGACPKESAALYETSSRGENDAVKEMMRQRFGSLQDDLALKVVLDVRRSQIK
jgi:hypothetical protein